MRRAVKQFIFRFIGKHPDAIVVSFATGDPELVRRMHAEIQALEPERSHFLVTPEELLPGGTLRTYWQLRKRFRAYRIGLAPLLLTPDSRYRSLRRAAFLLAPGKILAYNQRLRTHQSRLDALIFWLAAMIFSAANRSHGAWHVYQAGRQDPL